MTLPHSWRLHTIVPPFLSPWVSSTCFFRAARLPKSSLHTGQTERPAACNIAFLWCMIACACREERECVVYVHEVSGQHAGEEEVEEMLCTSSLSSSTSSSWLGCSSISFLAKGSTASSLFTSPFTPRFESLMSTWTTGAGADAEEEGRQPAMWTCMSGIESEQYPQWGAGHLRREVVWMRGKEEDEEWVEREEGGWTRGKDAAWTPLLPLSTPFNPLASTFSLLISAGVRGIVWSKVVGMSGVDTTAKPCSTTWHTAGLELGGSVLMVFLVATEGCDDRRRGCVVDGKHAGGIEEFVR